MANMNFGVNILPKANNTYSLGNSSYKWHAYLADINGTAIEDLVLPAVDSTDNGKILGVSSGDWTAITPSYLTSHQDITGKADKVTSATAGNVAILDANGNLVDSNKTLGISVPNDAVFTDTTYSNATITTHGLMSATDKIKLDEIQEIDPYETINTPAPLIHLTDAAEAPVKELEIEINPLQDLHGYENPWPAGGGKNKLIYPYQNTTKTVNGVTFTDNGDGTVTINGTPTTTPIDFVLINSSIAFPNGTYILSSEIENQPSDYDNSTLYLHFKANESDSSYKNVWCGGTSDPVFIVNNGNVYNGTIRINKTKTFNNCIVRPMIILSDETDYTFAPYSNICPISEWDTINIYDTKFNCYPEEWISDGHGINDTGNIAAIPSSSLRTDFFPIKANITYYYNFPALTGSSRNNIFWYDINKHFIRVDKNRTSFQVTSPSNAVYAKLATSAAYNNASGVYNNDICLNVYDETRNGEYEAYQQGHEYEISLSQTVYGGKLTIHGDGSREVSINKKFYHLTADDSINLAEQQISGFNRFTFAPSSGNVKYADSKYLACDKLPKVTSANPGIGIFGHHANNISFLSDLSTVEAFKEWLTEIGGLDIVYELETPITYQLTSLQIQTLLSENNIWANSGNINKLIYGKNINGLINGADKVKLDFLATISLTGDYDDLINKPDLSSYLTSVPTMTGATSSAAGTAGLAPAPTSADVDKFLAGDGTYKSGGLPMVILSYGHSTWAEFEAAYNNNVIVYTRASSNSNPASGSQTRMAFMAYVNNATTPTEVEFQYYRSMSSHSATAMGDQVFVYKLTKTGGWSVTTRDASIKQIKAGTSGNLSVAWSGNVVTIDGGLPAVTSADNGKILSVVNGSWSAVTMQQWQGGSY